MKLEIPDHEVEFTAIRAQGAGGQNVNKVSCAVHMRFNIAASSLPADVKERLQALPDQRITREGVLVIKAQTHRSLEMNRAEALARLHELVDRVATLPKARHPTKPSRAAKRRRLEGKGLRSQIKTQRSGRGTRDAE